MDVDLLTQAEFDALPEYSCTIPTGTTLGKKWRRREPYEITPGVQSTWYTGEYVFHPDPDKVGIRWRSVVIIETATRQAEEQ